MSDPVETEWVDPDAPRKGGLRGAFMLGARVLTGLIGLGVAIVVVGASVLLPLPRHVVVPRSVLVTPVATSLQRVCAGPFLQLGDASGNKATTPSSFGRPIVRTVASQGQVDVAALPTTDNAAGVAPSVLSIPPSSGGRAILFAGSQSQVADSGDAVGFAASECATGSGDTWLVGGATSTGRTTLVSLSNPTEVSATASLSIWTESGPVSAAGLEGIDVPAGGQRVISLAAFAPGAQSPVVRVQSRGGSLVATLQQTTVRTLQPGGVDVVDPTTGPATSTVLPGLVISNSDAVFAQLAQPGFEDLATVIRLLVPGTTDAHAELSMIPEGDTAEKAIVPAKITVKAGTVLDVPVGSYPDGTYTVLVTSDQPLVSGARVSTVGSTGASDFAWLAGAQRLSGSNLLVVAPGPAPQLSVANPADLPATVTFTPGQGDPTTVSVPAHLAVSIPAVSGASYTIATTGAVAMAVSYLGDAQLADFAVSPPAAASRPIRVYR